MINQTLSVAIGLLCIGAMPARVSTQEIPRVPPLPAVSSFERVRTLYSEAAYEDALAAMTAINGEAVTADVEQYRALCLLALGRQQEAVSAVERLVRDNPTFLPSAETSPRMASIVKSVRSKLVPDLAKQAYADARAAYESKNRAVAQSSFQRTLELISSLPDGEQSALADLRLLAADFLTLSAAHNAGAVPALKAPAASPHTSAKVPANGDFVPAIAVREQLPLWIPPDITASRTEYIGLLRIEIGADGRVTSAKIVKGSHPKYDLTAVTAAKLWLYKPATRGGQPVATHKDIHLRLVPQ